MRCPGILRSILINILGDFPERGVGFWNLGGTFEGSRTILWAVRFCGEPDDTADGGRGLGREIHPGRTGATLRRTNRSILCRRAAIAFRWPEHVRAATKYIISEESHKVY